MACPLIDSPRISLLVSDVDGTLVNGAKELTQDTIEAAASLAAAGVRLALVSSRPPMGFAYLLEPLKLKAPIGAFNGGAILNPEMTLIEHEVVPAGAAKVALTAFQEFGLDSWLFTSDTWYVLDLEGAYVPREQHTVRAKPKLVSSFDPYLDQVGKLVGSSKTFSQVEACESALQRRLGSTASAKRSQSYYLDVTPAGLDKGNAVLRIASVLSIPIAEVAVIGDMTNDLPMFEVAPFKIAMGNGIDDLKKRADFVTATNEDGGFAKAVRDFVLPRAALTSDLGKR